MSALVLALALFAVDGDAAAETPVACDGSLCETTNDSTCEVGRAGAGGSALVPVTVIALAALMVRRRRLAGCALALAALEGRADAAEPPDVNVPEPPPPRRVVAFGWNPLAFVTLGKVSADVVVVPVDHHAVVISPFYARTTTIPLAVFDDAGNATRLPEQSFTGFGAELGYRWYSGYGGPRGFFVGPSLLLASFTAKAEDGTKTPFLDLGLAADAGWQALVADRVALTLGAGVQYVVPTKSLPSQQFPANLWANRMLAPRLLASIGCAF
jgi:hypothetical protein